MNCFPNKVGVKGLNPDQMNLILPYDKENKKQKEEKIFHRRGRRGRRENKKKSKIFQRPEVS